MERVIFCVLNCMTILAQMPHTDLLEMEGGTIKLVEDSILLNICANDPTIPILYFSRAAYDEAITDLTKPNIQKVIQKRTDEWAPNALDQMPDWIYRRERECLTLAALSRLGSSQKVAAGIDAHFQKTIELLSQIVGEGRYEDTPLVNLLELALENEALLIAELHAAGIDDKYAAEAEIQERTQTVKILSHILSDLGQPQYEKAPPYVELWRAVYISPADEPLMSQLKVQYEPIALWKKGLVARWRVRKLSELAQAGRAVELLYYNRGKFLEDLQDLTPAQLTRTFEKRAQAKYRVRLRKDYLNTLRLEALLLMRTVHDRAVTKEPRLNDRLGKILELHTARLDSTLAGDSSWLTDSVQSGSQALARLLLVEKSIVQDVDFFNVLCRQRGRKDLVQRLEAILAVKDDQLRTMKALSK